MQQLKLSPRILEFSAMEQAIGPVGWGIIVGVPLLAIALSEVIERLRRRKIPLARALQSFRNVTLPLLAVVLIWQHVLPVEQGWPFQVMNTMLWLSILASGMLLIGMLLTPSTKLVPGKIPVSSLYLLVGRILVVAVCITYILAVIWQVDLVRITSALGIGSLVIALALQDTLSNLVSGFLLLLDRPFNEGDWLQIGDVEAEVLEMNWRSVRLRNRNRDVIVIPNGELGKATICNYTLLDKAHAERVKIGFAYNDPPNLVKHVMFKAVAATHGIVNPPQPRVRVKGYGDYAINYEIKFYLLDYKGKDEICSDLRSHIYYMAQRSGLTIPYPISVEYEMDSAALQPKGANVSIQDILEQVPYFATLDSARLTQLAQRAVLETYGTGEHVVDVGELDPGFFIIQRGAVSLTVRDGAAEMQEAARLGPGDCFGERVILRGEPSLTTAVVLEDLLVVRVPPDALAAIAARNPRFVRNLSQLINERTRQAEIAAQTTQTLSQSYLSRLFTS